ncbi:MAG TPA: class I SAM-dependent methyltransferase [Turneriella sp.]|nr:class I SAM-dependent methyltransferase [Turneriella sp.]
MQAADDFIQYQQFLISDQREKLIPSAVYTSALTKDVRENLNVLDFGCGHGYVAVLLAHLPLKGLHVYACDCDEECLDTLWGRIAHRDIKNLTAFHLSNYAQIYTPTWLPPIDHVFFSFSVSALEHPDISLPQIVKQMPAGTQFHFFDWNPHKSHPQVDIFVPPARRIQIDDFKKLLEYSGLTLQHEESGKQIYYTMRAIKT